MLTSRAAVFTATLLASAVPVAATNLVENGDFQTGSFSPWYNSTETKLIQEGANYYALLNSQLQQNMKVISGVFYTLSFDYIGTGNLSAQVSSGNLNANNLNATTWTRYVYTFTATSQKTLNFNAVNFKLDNITLVPGPIAGAGLPILVVFAGYAAWRRRQSTTAS